MIKKAQAGEDHPPACAFSVKPSVLFRVHRDPYGILIEFFKPVDIDL